MLVLISLLQLSGIKQYVMCAVELTYLRLCSDLADHVLTVGGHSRGRQEKVAPYIQLPCA